MQRKPLIAGNWKMHLGVVDACRLAADVLNKCPADLQDRDVLLAPPFTVLSEVAHILSSSPIIVSTQNICWEEQGAFTGEISPTMAQDCGATAAIIGHSERRQLFHEDDELINKRVRGALSFGLTAVLCIGETLEQRENDQTFAILESQISAGLAGVETSQMKNTVLAYEPVWAIGTGKTASKEQAQEAHKFIRGQIEKMFEKNIADQLRILYGGSVKPANIDELMNQADIDGALVGGAALDAESFGKIINFT